MENETLMLHCEIDADPEDSVKFSWTRNSSVGDVFPITNPRTHRKGLSSILEYKPQNDEDFATLACWAFNSVGRQKSPCVFNILRAGKFCGPYIIFPPTPFTPAQASKLRKLKYI